MNSFFTFQFGEFLESNPNWFDWFSLFISLIVSILGIAGSFWASYRIFQIENKSKKNEELEIQKSEVALFKNSLTQLKPAIEQLTIGLKENLDDIFSLKLNQGVNVDFLQFINIKYLYKEISTINQENIKELNTLLSTLFSLSNITSTLRNESRAFNDKHAIHEEKFFSYKDLLYAKYYELCNKRYASFQITKGMKIWEFRPDDQFMKEYSILRDKNFKDIQVVGSGTLNRNLFIDRFIIPLIHISNQFVPEDTNAIEVNDIANKVKSAFDNMEHIIASHKIEINSFKKNLENAIKEIDNYLDRSPIE